MPWSDAAAEALRGALGDDVDAVARDVETGAAELWWYPFGSWLVTRIEVSATRRELVLVALAGSRGREIEQQWEGIARRCRCDSMRVHSARRGASRYLAPLGYVPVQIVHRKTLHG